ncbi:MAG: winged helix-turn-helix domain-containing protein [Thermoplasmata archaeon]
MPSRGPTGILAAMMPGPAKITLDQESFKALASEVRVDILKKLDERRQTVTDLSNFMGLSKPTLLEHLEKLQSAGLVKRVDEGRKWIYYELSDKGRKVLHPERVSIVLALSSAAGLAAIGVYYLLSVGLGLAGAPSLYNGNAAPLEQGRGLFGEFPLVSLVTFVLAAAAAVIAGFLFYLGRRRRERFFSELAKA